MIEKAAASRFPVLLLGASGTGKEVVARAIHNANPRGQFVPIDCGSLVGTLMESELFGHVRGAFSGAIENKKGLVELADGGSAFFDEIGDLPLEMQVKLLRLVQEREFRAVGALQWKKADLRIIAATHRNLKAEVDAGRFRADLYYRLNVVVIHLPPLAERREDIPLLVDYFLREAGGERVLEPSREAQDLIMAYDWPGNVRELKHAVERMAALNSEGALEWRDLPSALLNQQAANGLRQLSESVEGIPAAEFDLALGPPPVISIPESEKQAIRNALEATGWDRSRAAAILKIGRTTLYRKMKQYGIEDRAGRHLQHR